MRERRRSLPEASLSFLDVISCGFGAIVLLLIIARVGDPAILEKLEEQLLGSVQELQERLFDIRGESSRVSQQLKSRQEQLSELRDRVARLQERLASVRTQSEQVSLSQSQEEQQLRLAMQVLTEEMERLQEASPVENQLIGGVPVDSEYVIFVIDTSGSMQSAAWRKVQQEMVNILDIYPQVKGIQVLNDMGQYMFTSQRGQWIGDSPAMRQRILDTLAGWAPFSNSCHCPNRRSVREVKDCLSSIRNVVKAVDSLNRAHRGANRLVRIHAIGFPVHFPPGGLPTESAVRFAALMRELSYNNGGTFIGLNGLK